MKLHLPKVLLTAVIAATACFQQAQAAATFEFIANGTPTNFHGNTYTNEDETSSEVATPLSPATMTTRCILLPSPLRVKPPF